MFFSEFIEHLQYSELSQVAVTNNGTATDPDQYTKIASYTNLGLTALHTRFPLREEETFVQQYDAITDYYLRTKFSTNGGSAEPIKYILDTVENPFLDNVIKIERVYNELGEEEVLNDEHSVDLNNLPNSLYTPGFDCLQISSPVSTNTTIVIYRAKHDKLIVNASTDITTIELNIPESMVEILTSFVAARVLGPRGPEGLAEANNYIAKYELLASNIERFGLLNRVNNQKDFIKDDGWV